jgi:hypothetical protein
MTTCFSLFSISCPQWRLAERVPYTVFSCTDSYEKIFVILCYWNWIVFPSFWPVLFILVIFVSLPIIWSWIIWSF